MSNRWEYLTQDPWLVRHAIAAHWLHGCRTIVEIGPYKVTTADWMPYGSAVVHSVDPSGELSGRHGEYFHGYALTVQTFACASPHQFDGLVCMGIDLDKQDAIDAVVRMAVPCRRVVLECALHYPRGMDQMRRIVDAIGRESAWQADLDIMPGQIAAPEGYAPYNVRRFIVL